MPLTVGTRLGIYEILAPLGAGGMGEVYRAHDTRLGRANSLTMTPPLVHKESERSHRGNIYLSQLVASPTMC